MAGESSLICQLQRVRLKFIEELDVNKLLPRLLIRGIFTASEEKTILNSAVSQKRAEVLLDILSVKGRSGFIEFCKSLEECAPHLLTTLVLDFQQGQDQESPSTSDLAERDPMEQRDLDLIDLEQKTNKDSDLALVTCDSLSGKEKNLELNSSASSVKMKDGLLSVEIDQVYEEMGPNVTWETHHITLHKAPKFGFGIAVSGGFDSPHFASGDPSVAISDVIKGGPAEEKLRINDRIVTVNGISLENVDHNTAINVLLESGSTVHLVVKRRILLPATESKMLATPLKVTLVKNNKSDEFGIVLGCKVFIKEIINNSLASHEPALHEGDTVMKISDFPIENLLLAEIQKLIDKSKDMLQLIITPEATENVQSSVHSVPESGNNNSLLSTQLQGSNNVNIFLPNKHSEEDIYVRDPTFRVRQVVPHGAYPKSENTRFDGRYVLDNDPPSWATLPKNFERKTLRKHNDAEPTLHDPNDGYYSDQDDGWRGQGGFIPIHKPGSHLVRHDKPAHELELRRVTFVKDKQTGLGLRLAGGNATGIFIASVHSRSAAEREGLLEGDKIILANNKSMTGMTREEAVSHLTNLDGQVTLVVLHRKEEYDRMMVSHEAGDSFYIRMHFKHTGSDIETEHSFTVGDIFHVKDTLFRGIGGSWLAIRVSEGEKQNKKGTIPNSKTAEFLKSQQKEGNEKENFPNRGRGSLFRRKSFSRRSKSLGKDHWEQIIFAGPGTKFPAYERVVYREPGFTRPVVIFGAIADIARERLLAELPERFDSPYMEKSTVSGGKKEKNIVITLGSIRAAVASRKHHLLDITPLDVDRLNYAQYNPIVVYLKAETKQAVKDIRSYWKTSSKSPRKLLEQSEKIEKAYSHLFTGQLKHTSTNAWFPKLCGMIESQQRHKIWISEKQPTEDLSDDLMFPMSSRFSCTTGTSSSVNIATLQSELDISPLGMQQGGMFSSDPSVNMLEKCPNVPLHSYRTTYKSQREPSNDSTNSVSDISNRSQPLHDRQAHPEGRYYPYYYSDSMKSEYPDNQEHVDTYAVLTKAQKLQPPVQSGGSLKFVPSKERNGNGEKLSEDKMEATDANGVHLPESQRHGEDNQICNASETSDSYSKYVNHPQNKHDDSKLQEKLGHFQAVGREKSPGQDSYSHRTARSSGRNLDRAKFFELSATNRKQDILEKSISPKQTANPCDFLTDKEASPGPVKANPGRDREKDNQYKNPSMSPSSNATPLYSSSLETRKLIDHKSLHQTQNTTNLSVDINNKVDIFSVKKLAQTTSSFHQNSPRQHQQFHQRARGPSVDSALPSSYNSDHDFQDSSAFTNKVYMNHFDLQKARQAKLQPGAALGVVEYPSLPGHREKEEGGGRVRGRLQAFERGLFHPQ